jgi:hypothetical protein
MPLLYLCQGFAKQGFGLLSVGFACQEHPKIFYFPPPALFFLQGWAGVTGLGLHGFQTL